jgi:DNA-binding transcriptional MerR regulator
MWQRRYGFPAPLRDGFGDRVYPPDQVARLKLIKQLLSEGWRAGAVVPLSDTALNSMLGLAVDEPTPLPAEIETAVKLLAQHRVGEMQNHLSKLLVGQGLSIIFISHKLNEVMAVSDRVLVLRGGKLAGERRTSETTRADLAALMVGQEPSLPPIVDVPFGGRVLVLEEVSTAGKSSGAALDRASRRLLERFL